MWQEFKSVEFLIISLLLFLWRCVVLHQASCFVWRSIGTHLTGKGWILNWLNVLYRGNIKEMFELSSKSPWSCWLWIFCVRIFLLVSGSKFHLGPRGKKSSVSSLKHFSDSILSPVVCLNVVHPTRHILGHVNYHTNEESWSKIQNSFVIGKQILPPSLYNRL